MMMKERDFGLKEKNAFEIAEKDSGQMKTNARNADGDVRSAQEMINVMFAKKVSQLLKMENASMNVQEKITSKTQ